MPGSKRVPSTRAGRHAPGAKRPGSQRAEVTVRGRMAQFIAGELTVADLDNEELSKGQFRADDGTFRGRPPKLIPREFHDAIVRELLQRGEAMVREAYTDAIKVFKDIAMDADAPTKDRLKAAQYLWERSAGKVPDRIEVKAQMEPWEGDVKGIVANVPEVE